LPVSRTPDPRSDHERPRVEWRTAAFQEPSVAIPSRRRRRLEELALSLLSRVIEASVSDLDRVLQSALIELGAALGVDHATVLASTEDRCDLRARRMWSVPSASSWRLESLREALPELTARVLHGEPVEVQCVDDLQGHAPRDHASLKALGMRSVLILPLQVGGLIEGALSLGGVHRARRWPAEITAGLRHLGHAVALALLRQRSESASCVPSTLVTGPPATLDLTDRQLEVLQLLRQGHTMKEVAQLLGISPRTVAFHKYRMREITGTTTNAELIRKAVDVGLVAR
jgi:DNA-binding CsgD family transcriptional regulator